ncbi:MAG: DUF2334 domain-containing protein [Actinomycetota bacterium]
MTRPDVVVSLHDVDTTTLAASRRWLELLAERDVPTTALVVCGPIHLATPAERREVAQLLDEVVVLGGEVSLHGWSHVADPGHAGVRAALGKAIARGCEEFWLLDEASAAERLTAMLTVLGDLGHTPVGMTPPGWLASSGARRAMRAAGLRYRTDHLAVHDLTSGRSVRAPALSHRSASTWQRPAAAGMALLAAGVERTGTPLRMSLHPADLEHPDLLATTLDLLDRALDRGDRAGTYADLLAPTAAVG